VAALAALVNPGNPILATRTELGVMCQWRPGGSSAKIASGLAASGEAETAATAKVYGLPGE